MMNPANPASPISPMNPANPASPLNPIWDDEDTEQQTHTEIKHEVSAKHHNASTEEFAFVGVLGISFILLCALLVTILREKF
jgi:hypothetical protein